MGIRHVLTGCKEDAMDERDEVVEEASVEVEEAGETGLVLGDDDERSSMSNASR